MNDLPRSPSESLLAADVKPVEQRRMNIERNVSFSERRDGVVASAERAASEFETTCRRSATSER
jgi:hypothetical protein